MEMMIVGVVLIGLGCVLVWLRKGHMETVAAMRYQRTTTISDVLENWEAIAPQVGPGNYGEIVELKVRAGTETPLKAPHTEADCVWYRASVIREYEEKVRITEKDKDGRSRTRTEIRRGSETVSTQESSDPFQLAEPSGGKRIEIRPEGAEVIGRESLNRFEEGSEYRGSWSLAVPFGGGDRRTIGWRCVEEILPPGAALYVLGEASDRDGPLSVVAPRDGDKKFLISAKSEEELIKEKKGTATMMLVGGIAALVIGVILLGAHFLQ
jgi:hypothetical protein